MLSEQRKKAQAIIGEIHYNNLRKIIIRVIRNDWEQPNHKFSPLLIEHLLYFIVKSIPIIQLELFPQILQLKFVEEYGYNEFPALLPKLVEDILNPIQDYCKDRFRLNSVTPLKAIEKVFTEHIRLYLEDCPINSKSRESIQQITGFPESFLKDFFKDFEAVRNGQRISNESNELFKKFFQKMCDYYLS